MNDWAKALGNMDVSGGSRLERRRSDGFRSLDSMRLPHYKRIELPLESFLSDPDIYLDSIGSPEFYITLVPKGSFQFQRFSKSGLTRDDVVHYVAEHVSDDRKENYDIVLQEYFENLFGGSIIINPDGTLLMEFKRGKQGDIASGMATPEFFVTRNRFTNSFRYSFADTELRETIYKTLLRIPHDGEGREIRFSPGYYEFIIENFD